jgi:quinol-cytochrome oxidoreductase complex cytochrome b subunit
MMVNSKPNNRIRKRNLLLAIHPGKIPAANLRFTHTFGLGGMSLVLILVLVITGVFLRFHYEPDPARAYRSVQFIQNNIVFGQLFRNVHHWAGVFLIVICFLHMLRTFLSAAFITPRRWNWVIGMILFLLVVFANFTGYLLPWDQLSYWAVTVSTSMLDYFPLVGKSLNNMIRGGVEVGADTLSNFYTFHTAVIPGLLTIFMVWHFWKVRKNGGVVLPRRAAGEQLKRVDTYPHLVMRELYTALALTALLLTFSLFFDAPLQDMANPAFSPNPAKSPWYFQGIQELLLHFHPVFAVVVIPLLLLAGYTFFPFIFSDNKTGQVDFSPETFKKIVTWSFLTGLLITPLLVLLDEYVLHFQEQVNVAPAWLIEGIVPLFVLSGLTWIFLHIMKKKFSRRRIDLLLSLFILFSTAYLLLTMIGTFFRGEGMELIF